MAMSLGTNTVVVTRVHCIHKDYVAPHLISPRKLVLVTHLKLFREVLLMGTHKICFHMVFDCVGV